jgi:hypothetical protein
VFCERVYPIKVRIYILVGKSEREESRSRRVVTLYTRRCQNSWRKVAFQCTITYRILVKRLFRLFLRLGNIQKEVKWELGSKCPSSYSTLKASIKLQILITTGDMLVGGTKM